MTADEVNSRAIQAAAASSTDAPAPRHAVSWFPAKKICQMVRNAQKAMTIVIARVRVPCSNRPWAQSRSAQIAQTHTPATRATAVTVRIRPPAKTVRCRAVSSTKTAMNQRLWP